METYEQALKRFNTTVSKSKEHNALILLDEDGWEEMCPEEGYWVFVHPEYPGIVVRRYQGMKYGMTYSEEGDAFFWAPPDN